MVSPTSSSHPTPPNPIPLPEGYLLGIQPASKLVGGLSVAATGLGFGVDAAGGIADLTGSELYMAWIRALAGPLVIIGLGVLAVAMGVQEMRVRAHRQRMLDRVARDWDKLVAGVELAMTTGEGVAAYLEAEGLGEPWIREPLLERLAAADRQIQGLGSHPGASSAR